MSDSGVVNIDPLFIGLTRPTMIFGVSFKFFFLNFFAIIFFYINAPGLKVIFLGLILHLVAYIICFKEPLFLELYLMKGAECTKCKNRSYYGGDNSYDPY